MVLDVCRLSHASSGIDRVVLSGGVWQNHVLLSKTIRLLEESGFIIYIPQLIPANDGGVSLGQAVVAANQLRKG
jgi:hydrogenase maturation protein HypF